MTSSTGFGYTSIRAHAKRVTAVAIGVVVVIVLLFFAVEYTDTVPDNAMVFVDPDAKTYFCPLLIEDDSRDFLVPFPLLACHEEGWKPATTEIKMLIVDTQVRDDEPVLIDLKRKIFFLLPQDGYTVLQVGRRGDLRGEDYAPDRIHRNWGGFVDNYGWFGFCMKLVGLRDSRWSKSGGWNW